MAINDVQQPAAQGAYKAKKIDGPLPEYDAMRARLNQQNNADTQQQQDAMQRRFAAQGGLNTGAAIKQAQIVSDAGLQKRDQGLQDISAQETAEQRRLSEAESNKEFQSNEAAVGRQFTASESQAARDLSKYQFDQDLFFKNKVNDWQQTVAMKQLDMAAKELGINTVVAGHDLSDDERAQAYGILSSPSDFEKAKAATAAHKAQAEQFQQDVKPTISRGGVLSTTFGRK